MDSKNDVTVDLQTKDQTRQSVSNHKDNDTDNETKAKCSASYPSITRMRASYLSTKLRFETHWDPLYVVHLVCEVHAEKDCLEALDGQAVSENLLCRVHDPRVWPSFRQIEVVLVCVVVLKLVDEALNGLDSARYWKVFYILVHLI